MQSYTLSNLQIFLGKVLFWQPIHCCAGILLFRERKFCFCFILAIPSSDNSLAHQWHLNSGRSVPRWSLRGSLQRQDWRQIGRHGENSVSVFSLSMWVEWHWNLVCFCLRACALERKIHWVTTSGRYAFTISPPCHGEFAVWPNTSKMSLSVDVILLLKHASREKNQIGAFVGVCGCPQWEWTWCANHSIAFRLSVAVQFGMVSVSAGGVGAMMAAIIASILDSCGDYIAYARTMGYPLPPKHAINRGVAMEGIATIVSGLYGFTIFLLFVWG